MRNYVKIAIFLLISVTCLVIQPAIGANRCVIEILRVVDARVIIDKEAPFKKVRISGRDYHIGSVLGVETSAVFSTKEGKNVVKIYSPSLEEVAVYEYWVTQYYQENGVPVVDVLAKPETVDTRDGEKVVVLKKYARGLTYDELINNPEVLKSHGKTKEQVAIEAFDLMNKMEDLHEGGRFESWLVKRGVNPSRDLREVFHLVREGDIKFDNLLYTEKGWIVIDP